MQCTAQTEGRRDSLEKGNRKILFLHDVDIHLCKHDQLVVQCNAMEFLAQTTFYFTIAVGVDYIF